MFAFKKARFGSFYSVRMTYFAFLVLYKKERIWIENLITCQILNLKNTLRQILNQKLHSASDFELKIFCLVIFFMKKFPTRQNLN